MLDLQKLTSQQLILKKLSLTSSSLKHWELVGDNLLMSRVQSLRDRGLGVVDPITLDERMHHNNNGTIVQEKRMRNPLASLRCKNPHKIINLAYISETYAGEAESVNCSQIPNWTSEQQAMNLFALLLVLYSSLVFTDRTMINLFNPSIMAVRQHYLV